MSQENKPYIRVTDDEIEAFVGWELPHVGDNSNVVGLQQKDGTEVRVVEEELAAEKITVAELESIREAARLEGLAAGLEEGRAQGRTEGLAQGVEEGKQQGYAEGFAQGEAEVQRLQTMFTQMVSEFEAPFAASLDELQKLILDYIQAFAGAVIEAELSARPELITQAIQSSLTQLPEPLGQIKLTVSEHDKSVVKKMAKQAGLVADVVADPSMELGGYRIETSSSLVEHELEARVAHVAEQLLADLKHEETSDS